MMIRTAERAGSGMRPTMGMKASKITKSRRAWIIPATGVRAPVLIFIAVRAIAPVAGRPPKNMAPKLAHP